MLKVTVDIPGIQKLTVDQGMAVMEEAINVLSAFAQDRVTQLANERLDADNAKMYRDAVQVHRQQGSVTISLDNPKVEKLEAGNPAFDIKAAMLRSGKVKQGKKGPYIDVPFAHSVSRRAPGQFIESRGPRGIVKALIGVALAGGGQQVAFKKQWSPTSKKRRIADMKVKPQGAKTSLVTFRRISGNSGAKSWIYPERKGLDIFQVVVDEVVAIKDAVVTDIIERHLKK